MATRPVVLVFQEFATLSSTAATPALNVCVTGPAYWIQDFPTDRASIKLTANYGTKNAAAPYVAPAAGTAAVSAAAPNNKAGAKVDPDSVKVFFGAPRVELAVGTGGSVAADSAVLTVSGGADFVAAGVKAGDYLITTISGATAVRRVRSATATTITTTDEFTATSAAANFRVERELADAEIDSAKVSVVEGTNTVEVDGGVTLLVGGVAKPVNYAEVYVAYRSLRTDLQDVKSISDPKSITGQIGRIDPRNPLAVGIFVALQNTNTTVQYYGVGSDDLIGYESMIGATSGRKDIYAVVPLSQDLSVVAAFKSEFDALADVDYALENGVPQKFRVVIGSAGTLPTTRALVTKTSNTGVTATVVSNEVTLVDTAATFIDSGVIVGDVLAPRSAPTELWTITEVVSNQRLIAERTGGTVFTATTGYEVSRVLDKDGQVTQLVSLPASVNSGRAVLCWPDLVDVAGLTLAGEPAPSQPGYYLACAVGGMVAALPSHQGLTNLGIAGIERLYNSNTYFTDRQITLLSNGGWMVFQQDTPSALPYIVHQLTTAPATLQFGELSMVKNRDYVSMYLADIVDDFIGPWNINKETIGFMNAAVQAGIDNIKLMNRPRIGAPLIDAKVVQLGESSISEDRVELVVEADFPKPLNTVALHVVSV